MAVGAAVGVSVGVSVGATRIAVGDGSGDGAAAVGATVGSGADWHATTAAAVKHDAANTKAANMGVVARTVLTDLTAMGGVQHSGMSWHR